MLEHQKRPYKTRKGHQKPNKPRKNGSLVPRRKDSVMVKGPEDYKVGVHHNYPEEEGCKGKNKSSMSGEGRQKIGN